MFRQPIKWKHLFYGLASLNLAIIIILLLLIFWPAPKVEKQEAINLEDVGRSEFVVRTSKKNLNDLVNAYLDKLLRGTNHQYTVELDEDVHLIGELPIFSSTVPLSIHFEPFIEDGNLILKQKSISIGLLQLPNKKIMQYVKQHLPMPEWVVVDPNEEEIYVSLDEMDIKSNFHVSVEHFDLEANNLAFKINIPYRTLGIEAIAE